MHRTRLSTLLVSINVALLLLTVSGVAVLAVHLLGQLANQQALARVLQAGTGAQRAVTRVGDDALIEAQVLAERPTLKRDLDAGDVVALAAYLNQYQLTSRFDGIAVLRDEHVVAQSGPALAWQTIWSASQHGDGRILLSPGQHGAPLLGAWASVPAETGTVVVMAQLLDDAFARQISGQIGLPVTILDRQTVLASATGPRAALRRQALVTGQPVTGQLDTPPEYLALLPLALPSGPVVGVVETMLPATSTLSSLRQLVATLVMLAVAMAAVSAAISFVVGRRLGRPLRVLTGAAARIGGGNLTTPIPPAPGAEIGMLAATLEEMRGRLLRLTSDLERQRAEAQAIITGVVEGVFTVDRERRIRYLNPQAATLLGIAPEEAVGRFCGDVLRPRGRDGVRPCEDQCPIVHARFKGGVRAAERLELASGPQRTVVITSAPPSDGQQVQVLRDETEVEATRRLRDTVLANISHEFKTPLTAQLASIELLLDQLPQLTTEQIGDLARALQRGALRLTELIENLLESVRIESGRDTIRRKPVALDEVVEEAVASMHPLIALRDQEIAVDLPYPLPVVVGDATRLTQVFVNLLANASKFAPAGSTIRIGGVVADATVLLRVQDEGPGLPPHAGPAIFERFVRASPEEPEQSGMGLGLWIVKSIVERHGGRVYAESGVEVGTRMCVALPVEQRHEDAGR